VVWTFCEERCLDGDIIFAERAGGHLLRRGGEFPLLLLVGCRRSRCRRHPRPCPPPPIVARIIAMEGSVAGKRDDRRPPPRGGGGGGTTTTTAGGMGMGTTGTGTRYRGGRRPGLSTLSRRRGWCANLTVSNSTLRSSMLETSRCISAVNWTSRCILEVT